LGSKASKGEREMATMVIHWKDKNIPNMEIKNATYKGGDSSIIKISTGDTEYWFNWQECWFLESIPSQLKS
jgi:hypothetical protein